MKVRRLDVLRWLLPLGSGRVYLLLDLITTFPLPTARTFSPTYVQATSGRMYARYRLLRVCARSDFFPGTYARECLCAGSDRFLLADRLFSLAISGCRFSSGLLALPRAVPNVFPGIRRSHARGSRTARMRECILV